MHFHNFKLSVAFVATILLASCTQDAPMFLNNDSDLAKIQSKIIKLSDSQQIDSVSIRSTEKKSLVSSIFVVTTDSDNNNEYKNAIEFLPQQALTLDEKTKAKKDALHSYKVNMATVSKHIETAKKMLPAGFAYKDVQSIRYSATPFGEKYYIGLEVKTTSGYETNEYIDVYYDKQLATFNLDGASQEQVNNMANVFFTANFIVENDVVNILKVRN